MTDSTAAFVEKCENKEAVICIVGMGYVGLPLMIRYASLGYKVIGLDLDKKKVDAINASQSYIEHITADELAAVSDKMSATTDFATIADVDAVFLCVPTPLDQHREPDLSYVRSTMDMATPYIRSGQAICLESTTYPGTTEEIIVSRLEDKGLVTGEDVYIIYSPEREDPGNQSFTTHSIPKVVGGVTRNCLTAGMALYGAGIDKVVPVSSVRVAEMTKLLENIHRAVNIGLVNEMKKVADAMGINIFEVIEAASTKPFGFTPYYPGPGIGGHCIPIDPFYLTWKAREYGMHTRFIELAGEINDSMPDYVVSKLADALNDRKKPLNGSRVLVAGIAYKKNVDDVRESPSVVLMERLRDKGVEVSYTDPHVASFPDMREHDFDLDSEDFTAENLATFDAVIIATQHDKFDYETLRTSAQMIVDTRGVFRLGGPNIIFA